MKRTLKVENLTDYTISVFNMTVCDNDSKHRTLNNCLMLTMPQALLNDSSVDFDLHAKSFCIRINCGYYSMLSYIVPHFLEALTASIEMVYEVAIEHFRLQTECAFDGTQWN